MRVGILATKLGMSRLFDDQGRHIAVTVLLLERGEVVWRGEPESDGRLAVQMGFGEVKAHRLSKAVRGHFAKAKVKPLRRLREYVIDDDEGVVKAGQRIGSGHFATGQFVDVSATSIGKGFAGVMKRHNFSGQRATHGVSVSHRAAGSTGQCQDPGRVFKGKKMAGRMGGKRATVQNLRVIGIDQERSLIFVKGGVPGHRGSWVEVRDACKRSSGTDLPVFSVFSQPGAGQDIVQDATSAEVEKNNTLKGDAAKGEVSTKNEEKKGEGK